MEDKKYLKADFTAKPLEKGEYENCVFSSCDFSGSSLARILFVDCTFDSCNLSMTDVNQTVLRDVILRRISQNRSDSP